MPIIYQKVIYREDLKKNPNVYYIFGDNEIRVGLGGQATSMRGEPNAIGVATLKAPGVFWSDSDNKRQCLIIDKDLDRVEMVLRAQKTVIIPMDGLGTGLAQLQQRAPLTFRYLQQSLLELESIR